MFDIQTIKQLDRNDFERLITGYTSHERYSVRRTETDTETVFTLELIKLDTAYVKPPDSIEDETLHRYRDVLVQGLSLGVYENEHLIALALAEAQLWNRSLYVHEFRIAEDYRRQGIGLTLMNAMVRHSRDAGLGLRVIVCETQNTNVPAIRFYRKAGFTLEGIDLSLYSNNDWPEGEIAVFMKRKL